MPDGQLFGSVARNLGQPDDLGAAWIRRSRTTTTPALAKLVRGQRANFIQTCGFNLSIGRLNSKIRYRDDVPGPPPIVGI